MSVDELSDEDLAPQDSQSLRDSLYEYDQPKRTMTIRTILVEELHKMKLKHWRTPSGYESLDDVVARLIIRYKKSEALGKEKLRELGLTPADEFYRPPPPAMDLEELEDLRRKK